MNELQRSTPLFTKFSASVAAIIFALFILTLHFMGRIPMCECGFGLWTMSGWSSSTSQNLGDPYSFSHVLHGLIFYGFLWFFRKKIPAEYRLIIAILIEVAWEIFENTPFTINRYRTATASLDYFGDSILNSVGDIVSMIVGYWFASKFSFIWSILIFVVIEFAMLYFLRDNLSLNVLMLIHPIDIIKTWQMAK